MYPFKNYLFDLKVQVQLAENFSFAQISCITFQANEIVTVYTLHKFKIILNPFHIFFVFFSLNLVANLYFMRLLRLPNRAYLHSLRSVPSDICT